jgi:hypothetical protein
MPFSFDTTIAIVNNAANELSRAARDLGDEQPESAITAKLRSALETMTTCIAELTAERNNVAARGTSGADVVILRDVQRDPNGMASPGADLPPAARQAQVSAAANVAPDVSKEETKKSERSTTPRSPNDAQT